MIALDTETTGVDLFHTSVPFFVTICDEEGNWSWWEWPVDPKTRQVRWLQEDLDEIWSMINDAEGIVLQNTKFDVTALASIDPRFGEQWPWHKTCDTLIAGHLLASNQPHDLASMSALYLGHDIKPYEDRLHASCVECRRLVRRDYPSWRIAQKKGEDMPSAGDSLWKYDSWLPKCLAKRIGLGEDHEWHNALKDYSNQDSFSTIMLWIPLREDIIKRGLWKIYAARLKVLPVAYHMERTGVTLSKSRTQELRKAFSEESIVSAKVCCDIAGEHKFELKLPKSGINNSLRHFLFGRRVKEKVRNEKGKIIKGSWTERTLPPIMAIPPLVYSEKTGAPSLDAEALAMYCLTLEGKPLKFVQSLQGKRKRDTAVNYMDSYERFWRPLYHVNGYRYLDETYRTDHADDFFVLHPHLNPTGTATLRWSSSNPNEQNISRQEGFNIRYCFGPAPGREWWSLDAKNIELRIPAYESEEADLVALFEHPDDPPYYGSNHLLNFHTVYPDIWDKELQEVGLEKVGPHCKKKYEATWYRYDKNGGFAIQYQAGKETTDAAFRRKGAFDLLKTRFTQLEKLNGKYLDMANKFGYVTTLPDKDVDPDRGYPLLCKRTRWGRIKPTTPLNYHVQGTAMWWMQQAMTRCQAQLEKWNLESVHKFYMILQVHDEIVFDFPKGTGKEPWRTNLGKIRKIQQLMERGGRGIGIPTPVSVEYHPVSWDTGVTL
jgi:DNA polymerase I-like protein with 3'-5' exonuclease and polymerase domains